MLILYCSVFLALFVTGHCQTTTCIKKSDCSCDQGTAGFVDLSPLDSKDKTNPKFKDIPDGKTTDTFSWNPCTPFDEGTCLGAAACQNRIETGGPASYLIASPDTADFVNDQTYGFAVKYTTGDSRTTYVSLICDQSQDGSLVAHGETYEGSLIYAMTLSSKHACPGTTPPTPSGGGGGLSIGTILCIVLLVLLFIYLVGGIVFNYMGRGARGVEVVPNVSFWKDAPLLVKDGALFVVNRVKGKTSSYENI